VSAVALRHEYVALLQRARNFPTLRLIPHPDPEPEKVEVLARAKQREALETGQRARGEVAESERARLAYETVRIPVPVVEVVPCGVADRAILQASLEQMHAVFRKWLGQTYDVEVLDAALAARLAHLCCKEDRPPWLLIVGGSGDAKTETVRSLEKSTGGIFIGTIISQATLLSGIGKGDADKDATGGLLKILPSDSFWLLIDVTSILSLSHDARSGVLDGFRFMFDGRWPRSTGGGGGRSEHWTGRIGVVGGVTTDIDRAHDSIQKLGSRYVFIRMDESPERRAESGRRAIRNTFTVDEHVMAAALDAAIQAHLAKIGATVIDTSLTDEEVERIFVLGDITTRVRSVVDYDRSGWRVIDRHALEAPTRFPKSLAQMFRGALLLGRSRVDAMRLVARLARESVPPLRRRVLEDVAEHPNATAVQVRERLNAAAFGIRRELEALTMLGALECEGERDGSVYGPLQPRYRLAPGIRIEWTSIASDDIAKHLSFGSIKEK
jgi:hypothetical protein